MESTATSSLQTQFGNLDIYVFDQLLRGRIAPGMRVFDAGCGGGRNLVYLLGHGYDVCANDADPNAIAQVRALASSLSAGGDLDFRVEPIELTSFPDDHADVVISNAVLHFARDGRQFEAMLRQMWRVLKSGGVFFARLASTIGIEDQIHAIDGGPASAAEGRSGAVSPKLAPATHASGGGRFRLPDGSDRFLVDVLAIESWTRQLGGSLIDPIKTTVVHNQRSMTTWVMKK